MHTFSAKSLVYLPLSALVIGIIPVLLLPPGEIFHNPTGDAFAAYYVQAQAAFPFQYGSRDLIYIQFLLIAPCLHMVWCRIRDKKTYHGLYALFIALGFFIKSQDLDLLNQTLLVLMMLAAGVNILAYLQETGDTFDDWLRYYFQKSGTTNSANLVQTSDIKNGFRAREATRTFKDIHGMNELKARLFKVGTDIIKNNGARNGILLTGEPGNGKTSIADALAGELKLPILDITIGDVQSMWVGETTQRVMKVFDDAERQAPCLLFIDEVEAILVDREDVHAGSGGSHEAPKLVSAILKRLEQIRNKRVVLVAATNYLDKLDPASVREGRFDFKIEVSPPDYDARKYLLLNSLKSVEKNLDIEGVTMAAKRWEGYSAARIRAVSTEVLDQYYAKKVKRIGFDELATAMRTLAATKGTQIPEDTLTIEQLTLSPIMRMRLQKLASRMINIERIETMGGTVPAGVLFYGPPGTGKTIGAMALAKASNWAFIVTTGYDLLHDPKNIEQKLKLAREIRPCIVFIDEADDVLADRRNALLSKDVTNKLLTAMDGAKGKTRDVLFIASTNAPDLIDEAMLRGGRFTEKIFFELPDQEATLDYVRKWIGTTKAPLGPDFTPELVAKMLQGDSLANAKEILQTAVNEAISTGDTLDVKVNLHHLSEAIRIVKG